jgi:TolB-like protein
MNCPVFKLLMAVMLTGVVALPVSARKKDQRAETEKMPGGDRINALINAGQLDSASALCAILLEKDSTNADGMLGRGVIAFLRTNYDECIASLSRAREIASTDSPALAYYLGASYGRIGRIKEAIAELQKWSVLPGDDGIKKKMRAQLTYYENLLFAGEAKAALSTETALASAPTNDSLIAVIPFKNMGDDPRYTPLQTGLADMVITDLSQVTSLRLVERTRIQKLLQEIGLAQAGLTQESDRLRVAKFVAASRVVGGLYKCVDSTAIKLKGGYIKAATGETVSIEPIDGNLNQFFALEKRFVFAVIEKMGIVLSATEREQIQKIPTENLQAFMAYSEGLDAADRGDFAAAKKSFTQAHAIDAEFKQAQEQGDAMTIAEELSTPPIKVQENTPIPDPPLIVLNRGPIGTNAAGDVSAKPIETTSPMTGSTKSPHGFSAGSSTGARIATLSQSAFMPEIAVPIEQPLQTASDPQAAPSTNTLSEGTAPAARPAYSDAHNLGLQNKTGVDVIIQIPGGLQ